MESDSENQSPKTNVAAYSAKSDADIRQILEGARVRLAASAHNKAARAVFDAAQAEAVRRGLTSTRTTERIKNWTTADVEEVLRPFTELTKSVPNNARLPTKGVTHAGGLRVKGEMAIDSYTAIKTKSVDAMLVAYAREKSDIPHFILLERQSPMDKERTETGRFTAGTLLEEALPRWRLLAQKAGERSKECQHDQDQS
jgi:hypothetical protein